MRRLAFFLIGALCGGVIGATVSVLNAPASGNAMRDEARARFDDMLEEARLAAETRRAELERQLDTLTKTPNGTELVKK